MIDGFERISWCDGSFICRQTANTPVENISNTDFEKLTETMVVPKSDKGSELSIEYSLGESDKESGVSIKCSFGVRRRIP
jgi:hypothetical protein